MNRITSIFITLAIIFTLSACSNNDPVESNSYEIIEESSDYSTVDKYDLNTLEADNISDFVNGKAWVQDNTDLTYQTYCIDKNGNKLFVVDGKVVYASPFYDDIAFVVKSDSEGGYFEKIYNVSGDELYVTYDPLTSDEKSANEHILAYGDGKFVVIRHKSDISNDAWYIGTIDKNGNTIDEFKSFTIGDSQSNMIDEDLIPKWSWVDYDNLYYHEQSADNIPVYVGDGCFILYDENKPLFYNPSQGTLIKVDSGNVNIRGEVSKGFLSSRYLSSQGNKVSWYKVDLKTGEVLYPSYLPEGSSSDYIPFEESFQDMFANETDVNFSLVDIGMNNGLIFYDHGYYDIDGNEVIHIKEYEDQDIFCSTFSDGYALMLVDGADGNKYVSIIDTEGNVLFDPIKTEKVCRRTDEGYFVSSFDGNTAVYNYTGQKVTDLNCETPSRCYVSEGFVRIEYGTTDILYRIPT